MSDQSPERQEPYPTLQAWEEKIRRHPLAAVAIATSTGFVLGAGPTSRTGMAMALFLGRLAMREATIGFVQNALAGKAKAAPEPMRAG